MDWCARWRQLSTSLSHSLGKCWRSGNVCLLMNEQGTGHQLFIERIWKCLSFFIGCSLVLKGQNKVHSWKYFCANCLNLWTEKGRGFKASNVTFVHACSCVGVCVCACVWLCSCVFVCLCMCKSFCLFLYVFLCLCVCLRVCATLFLCIHVSVCLNISVLAYSCIFVSVFLFICASFISQPNG